MIRLPKNGRNETDQEGNYAIKVRRKYGVVSVVKTVENLLRLKVKAKKKKKKAMTIRW